MAERRLTRKEIREGLDAVPIDTILLGSATGGTLTPSQREFARNLALGKSKAQSYREAISNKGTKKTQAAEGYKLARRPDIAQIKEAYALAIEAAKHRTPAQLRELVIHQLTLHALNPETKDAQRIKALELLGKVSEVAAFTERKEIHTVKHSEDIRGRLIEQLRALTHGAADAIPGEASQVDDADAAADSLLAELGAAGSNTPDPDPTGSPSPYIDAPGEGDDTHTIPHTQPSSETVQSAPCKVSYPSDANDINDLDVSPEQVQVRIEGEGGQIPPGDWQVVDGEVVPHQE
jgi:hypothetical protein